MKERLNSRLRIVFVPLIIMFLLCVFAISVMAEEQEATYSLNSSIVSVRPMVGDIHVYEFLISNDIVMRYRTMAQGLTAKERAFIILERAKMLGETLEEGIVGIREINGNYVVEIDGSLFITVTESDYKANNSTAKGLAFIWARNLVEARDEALSEESTMFSGNNVSSNSSGGGSSSNKSKEDTTSEDTQKENITAGDTKEDSIGEKIEEDNAEGENVVIIEIDDSSNVFEIEDVKGDEKEESPKSEDVSDKEIFKSAEEEMLSLINEERVKVGVKPLQMDQDLVKIARLKSQDMIEKNYFDHVSPTYGAPFTMMTSFGIDYSYAGENLAGNYSVQNAHEALMASDGHRKNILNPNYTHIGVGIVEGGAYGKMFTQLFISNN